VSGKKSFVAAYRLGGRNTPWRRVTIAAVGEIAVEEARKEAERYSWRTARTGSRGSESEETRRNARRRSMRSLSCRRIGKKLIGEPTRADIEKFMRDVAKTAADVKTRLHGRAIVEGGKGMVSRTISLLGGRFSFAVLRHLRPEILCEG